MFSGLPLILIVIALFVAKKAMDRASAATAEVERLRAALDALARKVWNAEAPSAAAAPPPPEPTPAPEPVPVPEPIAPEPVFEPIPEPIPEPIAAFEAIP